MIAFILWLMLFPLATKVEELVQYKIDLIKGKQIVSKSEISESVTVIVKFALYITVALITFPK